MCVIPNPYNNAFHEYFIISVAIKTSRNYLYVRSKVGKPSQHNLTIPSGGGHNGKFFLIFPVL